MRNSELKMLLRRAVAALGLVFSLAGSVALHAQADGWLAAQMAAAVPQLRARLPIQTDPITTWREIRAEGTEFVYDMSLSIVIPPERIDAVRQAAQASNQNNLCGDAGAGRLLRAGATMRHIYTDAGGHSFETRIVSCPPA